MAGIKRRSISALKLLDLLIFYAFLRRDVKRKNARDFPFEFGSSLLTSIHNVHMSHDSEQSVTQKESSEKIYYLDNTWKRNHILLFKWKEKIKIPLFKYINIFYLI